MTTALPYRNTKALRLYIVRGGSFPLYKDCLSFSQLFFFGLKPFYPTSLGSLERSLQRQED